MKFTEAKLEEAILELLAAQDYPHVLGEQIDREPEEVLIIEDLRRYLADRYADKGITSDEIQRVVSRLQAYPAENLYDSNKAIMKMVSDGFKIKRDDTTQADLFVELIDYAGVAELRAALGTVHPSEVPLCKGNNIVKAVNQFEIEGSHRRIPDAILYVNGLPLVVFEFKSAVREEATIYDAFEQITVRYRRDIPELFKYNAFCVISDGVNSKAGSFFAPYEFYYAWRKTHGVEAEELQGIDSLYSMINGLFHPGRLCDVVKNFVYLPNKSNRDEKILCRYPQYYAATKLYQNILVHKRPGGDGKGGTYFGATGSGKSYAMLFLSRLLMKSVEMSSPTIVLITDRNELDDQLAKDFVKAKDYLGDEVVISIDSREDLGKQLRGRKSGGVFLTTIQKFSENTDLLTDRGNVICISDEAHRSQTNLDQKVVVTEEGVRRSYGFARYLHDALPNATYVGFSGTPIDATYEVFGPVVDSYTMAESVADEITVPIAYEGRAAKVILNNEKLQEIEEYYDQCSQDGASTYAVEASKKANIKMATILGDPQRIKDLAVDFVEHYEARIEEGATVVGAAMFVCSKREIAYDFYKEVIGLRPEWAEAKACPDGIKLTKKEKEEITPIERIKMVMTRDKNDKKELYDLLGTKEYRRELDRQFKFEKSNFKIAIVVDMWLTGFDVPFLDTMYIDKPVKQHDLIQTISRVNRRFEHKQKGLIVDYIGIKKPMNMALKHYSKADATVIEDIEQSIVVLRDQLDLLAHLFHAFDTSRYFTGTSLEQLQCLNEASEYAQQTDDIEKRFMTLSKVLKAAYDICLRSDDLLQTEKDHVHFYSAIRSIIIKLTKGDAPDLAQMNRKVLEMITAALESDGVEELIKIGEDKTGAIDIFAPDYLAKIQKIKLPNRKINILKRLLEQSLREFKKTNRFKGIEFSKKFQALVEKYNERNEQDTFSSAADLEEFAEELIDLFNSIKEENSAHEALGIDFEEKAFYDILKALAVKYDFEYPEDKLLSLAPKVKVVVDDKAKYPDWSRRADIKAGMKVDLILLLAENGYPPVDRDEVYKEIFEQAENFKKHRSQPHG